MAETKCGTLVYLESKGMKISKTCKLNAYIIACGRLQGNTFKSDGVISIDIMCKDKPIQHKVDDISGTWIRKPAKKVTM